MSNIDTINDAEKKTIIVKVPLGDTVTMDVVEKTGRVCSCSNGTGVSENNENCEINIHLRIPDILADAAECLRTGGLVAFPTETVYGLGADGLNPEAAKRIYAAKGRPSDNPLIVHIADMNAMDELAYTNEKAYVLAHAFWPGPLTIILPKKDIVPKETTGGLDTVAIRMPSHPAALSLIRLSGVYVAAPSANISGRPSPTRAEHVIDDMDGRIDYIIDGGPVGIGIESTIVDLSGDMPTILRPGYITKKMLEDMIGEVAIDPALVRPMETEAKGIRPKAPGMRYTHYAPKGELTIVEAEIAAIDDEELSGRNGVDEKQSCGRRDGVNEEHSPDIGCAADRKQTAEHPVNRKDVIDKEQPLNDGNVIIVENNRTDISTHAVINKIREFAAEKRNAGCRVGIMAPAETIEFYEGYADVVICVGDRNEQATVAAGLYAALREFDEQGAEYIYAESFRGDGLSYAIMNRLLKAAGQRIIRV